MEDQNMPQVEADSYEWQSPSPSGSGFSDSGMQFSDDDFSNDYSSRSTVVRSTMPLQLIALPPELLESILRHLSFENVGKIRLVCQHFNTICSSLLNSEFHRLRMAMQQRFQNIKSQMPRRESARRKHPLARESDIIETLHMRLTLLHMTFGKHIERKHCCFFAGEILDEVYRILKYVKTTPSLSRAYKVTDELFDLSTMAMEYFKEHIEPTLPEITYFATDFLEYTPSLSSSPKTQLSLLEDPSPSSSCSPCKSPSIVETLPPRSPVSPAVNKRLRKLRENMKRNNGQVVAVKQELKLTRRRVTSQQKQIQELKLRFEDYDRKFQNTSRKLNAVLQELNRCKTELQYWRSKSPAAQCSCGKVTPVFELKELEGFSIETEAQFESMLPLQQEDGLETVEEFKPISAGTEATTSSSGYFVVVPACHNTPPDCIHMPSSALISPSKYSRVEKLCNAENDLPAGADVPSGKVMPKACKRKLEMGSLRDNDPVVKISKVQTLSANQEEM